MTMSVEENKELARRTIEEFINKNQPTVADEIFPDDFVNHNPGFGTTPDRAGIKQFVAMFHQASEDYHLTIEDLIAEKDKVVVFFRQDDDPYRRNDGSTANQQALRLLFHHHSPYYRR